MVAGDVSVACTTNRSFGCAKFDGINDFLTSATPLILNNKSFSISLWMKFLIADTNTRVIMINYAANPESFQFSIKNDSSGKLSLNIKDSTPTTKSGISTNRWDDNRWHNYIIVYTQQTSLRLYVDGVLEIDIDTTLLTANIYNSSNMVWGGSSLDFGGKIANIQWYPEKELSSNERNIIIAGGNAGGMRFNWKLISNFLSDINSNTLTNNGTFLTIEDDAVATAVKAQRVGANDKWMITKGQNGQIISVEIEA